jgi:hypothetical protein
MYVYDHYDNPLDDNEIQLLMKQLGIDNEDYFYLYKWKNGIAVEKQDYSVENRIIMPGNFVSLRDAVELDEENSREDFWEKKSLKPIMANYEGEHLLIETDKTSKYYNFIYFYSANFSYSVTPILYFESIEKMLLSIMALFNEKAQWFDIDSKRLKIDYNDENPICHKLNPQIEHWKR